MGYSFISQFAGGACCLILSFTYIGRLSSGGCHWWRGEGLRCLESSNIVWGMLVVHHGMKNACGGDAMMLEAHQSLRTTAFFWIALNQNIGHIFCTRFCLVVIDNQVIWPAYSFFQQFFYCSFIMIYLTLELLWNKNIPNGCDRPNRAVFITYPTQLKFCSNKYYFVVTI